jgi:hypothetical protein
MGKVHIENVCGWVQNPRIQLAAQERKLNVGDRDLTQEEVFEIMKSEPSIHLAALRDDILKRGLREPIIISSAGQLLDGNRRFFALKLLLETIPLNDPKRREFEVLPAYVLTTDSTSVDEELVLVEENFQPSLKIEWPDFVKATYIRLDKEKGLTEKEIADKYGWTRSKVKETFKIIKIIDDFITFATDPVDNEDEYGGGLGLAEHQAESIASRNYQFFNEAQKSFYESLLSDAEFKFQFFRWIHEDKFASFPEVRIAYEAWKHPKIRSIITSKESTAAKDAKASLDYHKRILKGESEARETINQFIEYLQSIQAIDIKSLSQEDINKLQGAIKLITDMWKSTIQP